MQIVSKLVLVSILATGSTRVVVMHYDAERSYDDTHCGNLALKLPSIIFPRRSKLSPMILNVAVALLEVFDLFILVLFAEPHRYLPHVQEIAGR